MLKVRAHGPWCSYKGYNTRCPKCKKEVFYWECHHGCKVFFDLPLRRPLTVHKCYRKSYREYKIELDKLVDDLYKFRESYSCPVCHKIFKSESALRSHLKSLRHIDDDHSIYYANEILGKSDY